MQAGLLREIVTLERTTITRNPKTGEQITGWSQVWRGRARVEFSSGTQLVENSETLNRVTRRVTIRTKPTFAGKLSEFRLLIDGDYYRILSRDRRVQDMATIMIVELINE
jgi:head-tail adaptor